MTADGWLDAGHVRHLTSRCQAGRLSQCCWLAVPCLPHSSTTCMKCSVNAKAHVCLRAGNPFSLGRPSSSPPLPVAVSHDDDGAGQQGLCRLCWSTSMWLRAGGSTAGGVKVQQLLPLCPVCCSVGSAAPWTQATQPVPNCTQQLQQGVPDHGWQFPQASQGVGGGLNGWPGLVSGAQIPSCV